LKPSHQIRLTLIQAEPNQYSVNVSVTELITYSQDRSFTRLNLIGGKVLEVKETTDQIDRLVRAAVS
jgi:hypothetical protein